MGPRVEGEAEDEDDDDDDDEDEDDEMPEPGKFIILRLKKRRSIK
jgi:hypothetical protein